MADEISDLAGVGEKTAEKLKEAGYTDFMSIAACSAGELATAADVGEETASRIISSAREKLNMGFETATAVLKKREQVGKVSTGSKTLDALLGGGIETQSITEAHGAFGCLTGDARITLSDGRMVPIGSLSKGLPAGIYPVDVPIVSMSGNSLVRAAARKLYVYDCENVLKVNLDNGMNLCVTPNHPLMTEYGWKNADDILGNDKIKVVADKTFPKKMVSLHTKMKVYKNAANTIIPSLPKELTPELSEIIAYILGEGWHERGNQKTCRVSRACFVSTDSRMIERFRELVSHVFGIEANKRYSRDNGVRAFAIDSVIAGDFLGQFGGLYRGAREKYVPDQIFISPREVVTRFLAAFYDCEGSVKLDMKKRERRIPRKLRDGSERHYTYNMPSYGRDIDLRSSSRKLLEGVQVLLTKLNIRSWINRDITRHYGREFVGYKLHITNRESIERFHDSIGIHSIRIRGKIEKVIESYKRRLESSPNSFIGIASIEHVRTPDGRVYDLEVPGLHNFLADNILSHNSGKSQLAHQLAVNVQLPKDKGGLGGKALFIDTEQTFRPERILEMAKGLGLDPKKTLENILVARAYNSDHQVLLAEKAEEFIKKNNVKIVIVDSLTSSFRSDYTGRGTLANRQQKLNRHLHHLQRLADVYNLSVYVTNQVMSRPDILFGDPTAPIGGHILGHQATFRVYLRKSKDVKRIAKLIDSPCLPEGETIFKVVTDGVRDA